MVMNISLVCLIHYSFKHKYSIDIFNHEHLEFKKDFYAQIIWLIYQFSIFNISLRFSSNLLNFFNTLKCTSNFTSKMC